MQYPTAELGAFIGLKGGPCHIMCTHLISSHLMYLNALGGVELFQHCQIPSATDTDLLSIIWGSKGFLRSVPLYIYVDWGRFVKYNVSGEGDFVGWFACSEGLT